MTDTDVTEAPESEAPEVEYVTTYVAYQDGTLEKVTHPSTTVVDESTLSKPGTVIGEADYLARLAQMEAIQADYLEELRKAEQAQIKADYQALRAAGIPDATARRLTGYTGP